MELVDLHDDRARKVDAMLDAFIKPDAPGCIVGVVQGRNVLHLKGYGLGQLEEPTAWAPDTISYIASITKHFVAVGILLLEDRGKLRLDDFACDHLPNLPKFCAPIRIRHLVTHTAGLPDDEALMGMAGISDETPCSLDYLFDIAMAQSRLQFEPGTHYSYGNTNYRMLARILECCSGQAFEEFLRTQIWLPLGMTRTWAPRNHNEIFVGAATGYSAEADGRFLIYRMGCDCSGDGSVRSTAADLLRWNENLRDNRIGVRDLVTRLTERPQLKNPSETTTYGIGTMVTEHRGLRCISHGGSGAGYMADFLRVPEVDLAVVALSNRHDARDHWNLYTIADAYMSQGLTKVRRKTFVADQSPTTDETLVGLYADRGSGYFIELTMTHEGLVASLMGDKDTAIMQRVGNELFVPIRGAFSYPLRVLRPNDVDLPRLNMTLGGREMFLERVTQGEPTVADGADATGLYYSETLSSTLSISYHDGELWLRRAQGQTPQHLHRMSKLLPDVFRADYVGKKVMWRFKTYAVKLSRDGERNVSGLWLSIGRARDVFFRRIQIPNPRS